MSYIWNSGLLLLGFGLGSNELWIIIVGAALITIEGIAYKCSKAKKG